MEKLVEILRRITMVGSGVLIVASLSCSDDKNREKEESNIITGAGQGKSEAITTHEEGSEADNKPVYAQTTETSKKNKFIIDAGDQSFKGLDKDSNGIVNKVEFYDGVYMMLDSDKNNQISKVEFDKNENFISKQKDSGVASFEKWDMDKDSQVSKEEFNEKMKSMLDIKDKERLAQNLYIVWDTDNDDKIEKLELENVVIRFDKDDN